MSFAVFQADINQDYDITLEDIILGFQIVAGDFPAIPGFIENLDVDNIGNVGLGEVVNALQSMSSNGLAQSSIRR